MEILQITMIGIIATIFVVLIKSQRPEFALQISIVTGIIIFMFVVIRISVVIDLLSVFINKVDIDMVYFTTLLKIIGIAYVAEFGAEVCRDAGESSIASKIELGGKVIIMVLAVPIISSLLELISRIMR